VWTRDPGDTLISPGQAAAVGSSPPPSPAEPGGHSTSTGRAAAEQHRASLPRGPPGTHPKTPGQMQPLGMFGLFSKVHADK